MRFSAIVLLLAAPLAAQDSAELTRRFLEQERRAFALYQQQKTTEAIAAFEAQIALFPDNPRPYYNIACLYALANDASRAETWLKLSIHRGWRDAEHLAQDPDFDKIRGTAEYRRCDRALASALRTDPHPLPRRLPTDSAPPVNDVRIAVAASALNERLLRRDEQLLGAHEFQKRLFANWNARLAVLSRYLAENPDAPDAAAAAHGRVETATLYLQEADPRNARGRRLEESAARLVLAMADEFYRGHAGSRHLAHVKLLAAHARRRMKGGAEAAARELRSWLADHPDNPNQVGARMQLAGALADLGERRELRALMDGLHETAKTRPEVAQAMRGTLQAAQLRAYGLPQPLMDKVRPLFAKGAKTVTCAFVAGQGPDTATAIEGLKKLSTPAAVFVVDPGLAGATDWLAARLGDVPWHFTADAPRLLWMRTAPLILTVDESGAITGIE